MKIVCAIDSFKGSLSSALAEKAAEEGIKRAIPDADVLSYPVADGGEGTTDALLKVLNGRKEKIYVTGPFGKKTACEYGIAENSTAILEMSAAAGITLVDKSELDPLCATTYGVGEMIADAIKKRVPPYYHRHRRQRDQRRRRGYAAGSRLRAS